MSLDSGGVPALDNDSGKDRQFRLLVAIVWFGLFLAHANKALGFCPLTIPDDYWYIYDVRHRAWADTVYPGYVYYLFYWVTNLFQYRFLDAGRVLNAFFFVLSGPFIYKLARLVCGRNAALFVALLILVSPISSFTAFFMPESLYFTVFWALAWLMIEKSSWPPFRAGALFGVGVAILSMVKMHGLFLIFGFVLYVLLSTPRNGWKSYAREVGQTLAGMACCFLVVRLGFGFAIAGVNGLNILGAYGEFASESAHSAPLSILLGDVFKPLFGHLAAISLYFGLPIVLAAGYLVGSGRSSREDPLRRIILLVFCFLPPLLIITISTSSIFTATRDVYETSSINWRYYNYLFPAFPIIVAGVMDRLDGLGPRTARFRLLLSAIPVLLCLYILVTSFDGYIVLPVGSNPEFGALKVFTPLFYIGAYLLLAVLIVGACAPRFAAKCYLYAVLPAMYLFATFSTHLDTMLLGVNPDIIDKGGIFARDYLGEKCSELTVVDGFYGDMAKALIYIDNAETDMLPQFTRWVDMSKVKPGKKWLLVFSGIQVPPERVKSAIEYIDPRQTPEMTAAMQTGDGFRLMLRYALVELK